MSYTSSSSAFLSGILGRRDWENQFGVWGSPPGKREQDRYETAVREIKEAIGSYWKLKNRNIRVFVQGSYKNRVNVREDSDVDIGVECEDIFFHDLPAGSTASTFGFAPGSYEYSEFKKELGEALTSHFGYAAVTRGKKAFDIKATQRQVAADVAPFFQHRRYAVDGNYSQGVELRPDDGGRVVNWPSQHYDNGVRKHSRTNDRFKKIVRILKCLRNEMDSKGRAEAKTIPSFLVECLVYNAPTRCFDNTKLHDDVMAVLGFLRDQTVNDALCAGWLEVSEMKYLFAYNQKWTRQQAHDFVRAAESYILAG